MIFHSIYNKPVLLVGNGVRSAGASELVYKFIEKTNIPCLTTMNAVDLVQDGLKIGFIGTYGNRIANMILNECDLVISVGARLGLRQIGHVKSRFAPKAKLIRVDVDQYELGRQIKEDEEQYHLDAKYFLELLLQENVPNYKDWGDKCIAAKQLLDGFDDTEGNKFIDSVAQILPSNPIVAVDVGQHQCWTAQSLWLKGRTGRIFIGGGYGAMGCGLPYAIGASICNNKGVVFCITGDGGLQMNIQELETVKRENLPIKIIVVNNEELGKISEVQHVAYGDRFAQTTAQSGYTVPDFELVAKSYGIKAKTLSSYKELNKCKEWFADKDPCLINVKLASGTLLIPKIKWETGNIEPQIDEKILEKIRKVMV